MIICTPSSLVSIFAHRACDSFSQKVQPIIHNLNFKYKRKKENFVSITFNLKVCFLNGYDIGFPYI